MHKSSFESKKEKIISTTFGFIFSAMYIIGFYMEQFTCLTLMAIIKVLVLSSIIGMLIAIIFPKIVIIYKKIFKTDNKITIKEEDNKCLLRYMLILLICWIPVLLAYYPGIFGYDVISQISQVKNGYTTFHPLIHTVMLNLFYSLGNNLGNVTLGMFLYTIVQMIIFSFSLSYLMLFIKRVGMNIKVRIIILIFFSITPFFSILAISMTKDIIFSAFIAIFLTTLAYFSVDYKYTYKKIYYMLFIISAIGICLFRNNGIYVLSLLLVVELIMLKYRKQKRLINLIIVSITFSYIFSIMFMHILKADKGTINEMLSIPYQQIACTYKYEKDNLTEKESDEINRLIPNVEKYNYSISDPIKSGGKMNENIKDSINLYIKLLIKYPVHYIEAFLRNTQGYWYIDDITNSKVYGENLEDRQGYLLTDTKKGFEIEHRTYFTKLEMLYERLFSANEYRNYIFIAPIFSLSIYLWIIIFAFCVALRDNKKQYYLLFRFTFFAVLTYFAGPCSLIRYALPYIVCVPVLITVSNLENEKK